MDIHTLLKKKNLILGITLFLIVFLVFTYTTARYHVSFADSDEMSTIGYLLGVAHQPGYPIYILLVFIATHIIPFGSIAFKANILSAFIQSVTIFILFFVILEVLKNVKLKSVQEKVKKKKYKSIFYVTHDNFFSNTKTVIAFLASLMVAFSYLFWLYANIAEVFALNDLFLILLVFILLKIRNICYYERFKEYGNEESFVYEPKIVWKKIRGYLLLFALLSGLSLGHLQTIVFAFPALFGYLTIILLRSKILTLKRFKEIILFFLIILITFILPFFLLFFYNNHLSPVSWQFDPSFIGLIKYIFRSQYAANVISGSQYLEPVNALASLNSIAPYFSQLTQSFTIFTLLISLLGFIVLFLRNRGMFAFLFVLFFFTGLFFIMYAKFPVLSSGLIVKYYGDIAILQRQLVMNMMLLGIFIGYGLYAFFTLVLLLMSNSLNDREKGKLSTGNHVFTRYTFSVSLILTLIMGSVGVGYEIKSNFDQVNLRDFSYIEDFSRDSLNEAAPNSVVVCFSDFACFGYLYEQNVEHVRRDLLIVPDDYQLRKTFLDSQKDIQRFYYSAPPNNLTDIISWSLYRGRSVYLSGATTDFISYMGLNGKSYFLYPVGYLLKVVRVLPNTYKENSYSAAKAMISNFDANTQNGTVYKDYMEKFFEGYFTGTIVFNLFLAREEGYYGPQKISYNIGYNLDDGYEYYKGLINQVSNLHGNFPYYPGLSTFSSDHFYQIALSKEHDASNAIPNAQLAVFIDPTNIDARLLMAEEYQAVGENTSALTEYRNVLALQPNNKIALEQVNTLLLK